MNGTVRTGTWAILVAMTLGAHAAIGAVSPIQLGLTPDRQLISPPPTVVGLSLGLTTRQESLYGASINLWASQVDGDLFGVSLSLGGNFAEHHSSGMQLGLANGGGIGRGLLQAGGFNQADRLVGVQVGLINYLSDDNKTEDGAISGAQIGLVNAADALKGLQFGLLNEVASSNAIHSNGGLQVGVLNVDTTEGFAIAQAGLFNLNTYSSVQVGLWNLAAATRGLQLGAVNVNSAGSNTELYGVQAGLWNASDGLCGVQVGVVNKGATTNAGNTFGLQAGAWNSAASLGGLQMGLVNTADQCAGLQIGAANIAYATDSGGLRGVQVGLINHAARIDGVQLGILNIADELYGLQIGLLNIARNDALGMLPIMNFHF